jgi:hypothetical protein
MKNKNNVATLLLQLYIGSTAAIIRLFHNLDRGLTLSSHIQHFVYLGGHELTVVMFATAGPAKASKPYLVSAGPRARRASR